MVDKSKSKILIADDEKATLDVLNHMLKSEYTVLVAKTGQTALRRAHENKPDLILLDIAMPDMDGYDVLSLLKESDATRTIPVIFITGLTDTESEEKGFFLGAVDYITKPFNNSIVKARVKTHLKIIRQIHSIERLGMIDALTEIPNRRSFDKQINIEWNNAMRENTPLSLLMMDVDNFKAYNDTYKHPQGDVLLQELSKIFLSSLKRPVDSVARVGGEEFAIILPNTDLEGAVIVAEKIRETVAAAKIPNMYGNNITSATISIGVASITPSPDDKLPDFILKSDNMLYKAKNTGRNRVCSM